MPTDPDYELPNNSQLAYWSYATKVSHRRNDTKYRDFDQFVEMTSNLTFIEVVPDPKDPNKDFVFCTSEKGMSGKVTFSPLTNENDFVSSTVFTDWHLKCTTRCDQSLVLPEWSPE